MTTDTADKQVRTEASRWAERLMDREFTATERAEFQRWLMANELHQKEFRTHNLIVNLARDLPAETRTEMLTLAMQDAHEQASRRKVWISGLAASLLLTLGLAGWFSYRGDTVATTQVTTAGMTRDITLPDGSVAHLNARTKLRWIGRSGERRVALLEGEALFEVIHDPAKSFTVVLDASEIRDLGTRFNVRRRQSEEVVVTVLDGSVEVRQTPSAASTQVAWTRTLHANEQLVYNSAGLVRDVYASAGANAAKWREGILEFQDEPLTNIVEDLGRYADRQILVRDSQLGQLRLGGQLNVHDNIKDSLGLLEKLAPVAVHESGNTYVLEYRQEPIKERH